MFRGLVAAGVLEIIPLAERSGPVKVRLNVDLQEDFTLNQALGIYLLEAIPQLDADAPDYALNVVSLVEAILENPDGGAAQTGGCDQSGDDGADETGWGRV